MTCNLRRCFLSSFPNVSIGNPLLADNHCRSIALRLNLDSRQRRSAMTARGRTAPLFVGLGFVIAYMTNVCVVNCGLVCVVAGLTRNLCCFFFPLCPIVSPTPSFPNVSIGNPLFPQSASFFNSLCRLFSLLVSLCFYRSLLKIYF
jgi:hypothetical protein